MDSLERFVHVGLRHYESKRHLASEKTRYVARVSPYLRFGMLSPRAMYHELRVAHCRDVSKTFWRRLVWRDLAYWQLHLFPHMQTSPIRRHYEGMHWTEDTTVLRAWQKGMTGYPLVDAGMRELWATERDDGVSFSRRR